MSKELNNTYLYSLDSKGKVREWKATTDLSLDDNGYMTISIEHGQQYGKKQTKERKVKSGKNKGKANETSLEEQTYLEIGYLYQKQLDQGYVKDVSEYQVPKRPMLAHKYKDKFHIIKWVMDKLFPGLFQYASRKLNGIRCFIFIKDGVVTLFESRTGKAFKFFKHLEADLVTNYSFKNRILDGELFHPEIPFEIIASLVNSDQYTEVVDEATGKTWSTEDIQFHCYDMVDEESPMQTFYERFILNDWYNESSTVIKMVESIPVHSEADMITLAKEWIKEGFEGLMLRAGNGLYDFGKRSANLLKYKVMEQEEFLIKHIYLAENDEGKVMFTLNNHHSKTEPYTEFDCALKGNKEFNMSYYDNKETHINKSWLTVDYQVLSSYNVPLFPVGIIVREGEVVDGQFIPTT